MAISRRRLFTGSALIAPLAAKAPASIRISRQFDYTIMNALLGYTSETVKAMAQGTPPNPRPFAAEYAIAELAFFHFEETGFSNVLDQHLSQFVPDVHPGETELAATVRNLGMSVPQGLLSRIVAPDVTGATQTGLLRWPELRPLLLRGLEIGMTTLTAPRKTYTRATWEAPWPRIVRTPLRLKSDQLAAELPRVQAGGHLAINLGMADGGPDGMQAVELDAVIGTAHWAAIAGAAVFGLGLIVFLICHYTEARLATG